jgi:hypothetical protein
MSEAVSRSITRAYATQFQADEDPLSEGGIWVQGRTHGIDWVDVKSTGGVAIGEVSRAPWVASAREQSSDFTEEQLLTAYHDEADYDDPTALLGGRWGRNQHGRARVFSRNPSDEYWQEVEIRLRSTIGPHLCTGYEVFWRCLTNKDGYVQIARWNGAVRDFTILGAHVGPEYGVADGDQIEAAIVGNVITGWRNGVKIIEVTDDVFTEGGPGIGFNFGAGNTNFDHGLTSFEVETWDD